MSRDDFDELLAFLSPNREEAALKYEEIRRKLLKIFACRGCAFPEELVDESMDRVAAKASVLRSSYEGDPRLYFYGVARLVFLESVKKRPRVQPPPPPDPIEEREPELQCLEECMERLPREQRELIREYYRDDKRAKIENRRKLAAGLGIGLNALRIRAHRARQVLMACVSVCLENGAKASSASI